MSSVKKNLEQSFFIKLIFLINFTLGSKIVFFKDSFSCLINSKVFLLVLVPKKLEIFFSSFKGSLVNSS